MPAARPSRGRAPQPLSVPGLAENAAERKRALNVLAQRRYRARKRASKSSGVRDDEICTSETMTSENLGHALTMKISSLSQSSLNQEARHATTGPIADSLEAGLSVDGLVDVDFDFDGWSSQISPSNLPFDAAWPLLAAEMLPPFPASDASSHSCLLPNFTPSSSGLSPLLQDYETATASFPDTYLLPIPALGLLRACLIIAKRLGIATQLWDCASVSPFYVGSSLSLDNTSEDSVGSTIGSLGVDIDIASLPENLRPTRTQYLLPHHPLLDILPWPSVRDKLIMFFAQPAGLRPESLGRQQLVEDLEDEAEGVVVRGGQTEPWEVDSWEIGKALEKRWWFVLDTKVKRRR